METSLQLFNNLLSNYKLIGRESLTMVEIDNILSQVNVLVNSSSVKENADIEKDFATKEQREVFLDIMSKITCTKTDNSYPDSIFYMDNDSVYMEQDLKTNDFYIRYYGFWRVFETKFDLNYYEISELLRGLLEHHLKCEVNTTWNNNGNEWDFVGTSSQMRGKHNSSWITRF
jgi:hypothetical protein